MYAIFYLRIIKSVKFMYFRLLRANKEKNNNYEMHTLLCFLFLILG